jgi:hypothetical protein
MLHGKTFPSAAHVMTSHGRRFKPTVMAETKDKTMKRKDGGGPHNKEDGGQSQYWDGFTGGLTAKTPRFKISENDAPRPRYSDEWANSSQGFSVKGPDINEISRTFPYRGPGR